MLDLSAKTVWRIAFGDYDFAIDRKTLQYRLEETKTGTVWADGLPVGSVELEERETGARTVYDFADAKLVTLSEKAGAHGKRILFGLDLFGIPIDIYFTCAPREIQLTVEASRDTRAHRVQIVRLLPGLCAAPRREGLTAHLVLPLGSGGFAFAADATRRPEGPLPIWDAVHGLVMPFVGATQATSESRTALGLITDSAYCAANFFYRASDDAAALEWAFERDPERRRLDVRVVVLPGENHVGIARAYREKIIGEKNHILLRRKIRERPPVEAAIGAGFFNVYLPPRSETKDILNFSRQLKERHGVDRALLLTSKRDDESFVPLVLPDGFVHGAKTGPNFQFSTTMGAVLYESIATKALKDNLVSTLPNHWEEMEARLQLLEQTRIQGSILGVGGWCDWATTSTDFATGQYLAFDNSSLLYGGKSPLHCVVYHDSLVLPARIVRQIPETFLGVILCLMPPIYEFISTALALTSKDGYFVTRTYAVLSHLHRFCWASFLTSHEFLTPDYTAQEARYSNGAHVIINASATEPFENELVSLPPLGFYASCKEMTAHDAYRVGAETFATRAWRIARSRDGKPLATSGDVFRQEFPVEPADA